MGGWDPSRERGRGGGRLDGAYESCCGEGMQSVVHGLKGHMADEIARCGCDRLDAEVVTTADGGEECDAGSCDSQAGTAQILGRGRSLGRGHHVNATGTNTKSPRNQKPQT